MNKPSKSTIVEGIAGIGAVMMVVATIIEFVTGDKMQRKMMKEVAEEVYDEREKK